MYAIRFRLFGDYWRNQAFTLRTRIVKSRYFNISYEVEVSPQTSPRRSAVLRFARTPMSRSETFQGQFAEHLCSKLISHPDHDMRGI
jgi:hypothetical protein